MEKEILTFIETKFETGTDAKQIKNCRNFALYLDSFCNMTGTTKRYVNQWLPIVAAARIYKDNPEEFDILKSMIKVHEY